MNTNGKKTRPAPTTMAEAMASRAEYREAGKRWRERATTAEAEIERYRGELVAAQLQIQEQSATLVSLDDENKGLREEVESADAEVAALQAQLDALAENQPASGGGVTIIVSKDGGAVLEAIALAQESALEAIATATNRALSHVGGVTFTDGPSTYGDEEPPPVDNTESTAFDFTFEDDDEDVELAADEDDDTVTVSDDSEDEIVAHTQNARDMGDGSDASEDDDFSDDDADETPPPLQPGLDDIDASLTVPNLIDLISATAEGLGETWRDNMATFVTQALATSNTRLIVREAINLLGVNGYSESDLAHAHAFANSLEADDFNTVLAAILAANGNALENAAETPAA